jgi:hypothetical protein
MINPRFDPNNYTKHHPIIVIKDYQQIDKLFESNLLLVKWKIHGTASKVNSKNTPLGIVRKLTNTPIGELAPSKHQLAVNHPGDLFIQFLQFPPIDFPYSLEVANPYGISKTIIEFWEYIGVDTLSNFQQSSQFGNTNIMSISYPSATPPTSSSGTSAAVAYSATSVTIAAANAARIDGGMVINNANRNLWVNFSATAATTAAPSILVPANGGSIDIPSGYVGAVTGIWVTGGTGNATVVEFV